MADADPKDGLDVEALGKLYKSGFADLDEHFVMLQDLMVKTVGGRLKAVEECDEEEAEEDDAEGDEEESDGEEADGDAPQILECEDEDEFEEVMRVLGLQSVTVTETGDLRLPNGSLAAHRDVAYIYRQRGVRKDADQLALAGPKKQKRAQLMLSNGGSGCLKIAMSKSQQKKEGKFIIAVLREKNKQHMRQGVTNNIFSRSATKIRTGRGDCSNGR